MAELKLVVDNTAKRRERERTIAAIRQDRTLFKGGMNLDELDLIAEAVKRFAPGRSAAEALKLFTRAGK